MKTSWCTLTCHCHPSLSSSRHFPIIPPSHWRPRGALDAIRRTITHFSHPLLWVFLPWSNWQRSRRVPGWILSAQRRPSQTEMDEYSDYAPSAHSQRKGRQQAGRVTDRAFSRGEYWGWSHLKEFFNYYDGRYSCPVACFACVSKHHRNG